MHSSALASVRAKISRAQVHFDAVKLALQLTMATKLETESLALDVDLDGQHAISRIRNVDPIEPSLPQMIGDCIHNLRSALDHLVFQLAVLNGASRSAAEKTMFPICLSKSGPNGFDARVQRTLKPFITKAALAEVEESQPYKAYPVPNESDIWVLHQLDIIDKHRLLLVARDQFAAKQFWYTIAHQGTEHSGHVVIPEPQWKPMENGAEIIRFRVTGGPPTRAKIDAKIEMIRTVQFVNTRLACDGMPIADVLSQLFGIVDATVRDFGLKFFGE